MRPFSAVIYLRLDTYSKYLLFSWPEIIWRSYAYESYGRASIIIPIHEFDISRTLEINYICFTNKYI